MFEYYVWAVCFITLYIAIFWISINQYSEYKKDKLSTLPSISIAMPAYNEEKNISNALNSLINLEYPKEKLEIIVVDDCSTDNTISIVKEYVNKYKYIKLLRHKINKGNAAHSLNTALRSAKGELFARLDADSVVDKNSLIKIVPYFSDSVVGAVVSPISLIRTKNMLEKIQRLEYMLTNFIRNLMAKIHVLHYTTGVLTVYRTDAIKKLGYFDEDNITEDFEIAMRLNKNGYKLKFEPTSTTYTYVPNTLKKFWDQRIRWYRGFIFNSWRYRDIVLNRKYGLLGVFQTPINLLFIFILITSFIILLYQTIKSSYNFFVWILVTKWDIFNTINIPGLKELILSLNVKVIFPILITILFSVFIYFKAHKQANEKWKFPFTTLIYLFVYPFIITLQWMSSLFLELIRVKRKW